MKRVKAKEELSEEIARRAGRCCRGCVQRIQYDQQGKVYSIFIRWLEDCQNRAKGETTEFYAAYEIEVLPPGLVRAAERAQDNCLEVFVCWYFRKPGAGPADSTKEPRIDVFNTLPPNRECCPKAERKVY
jgi:hypothetical protein